MKSKLLLLCIIPTAGFNALFLRAADHRQQPPSAQQLMAAAHTLSDFTVAGPYALTAEVSLKSKDSRMRLANDQPPDGKLIIYRDHDKARADLQIGTYREDVLVLGRKQYIGPAHVLVETARLFIFDRSWDPEHPLPDGSAPRYMLGDVYRKKIHGSEAWCVDNHSKSNKSTFCFDAQRSVMLEQKSGSERTDFLDFMPSGDHFFPQTVEIRREYGPQIILSHIQVTPGPVPADSWVPPQGSIEVESCANQTFPVAEFSPEPGFPPAVKGNYTTATVLFSVVIDKTGKAVMAQPLVEDSYGFAAQSKKALQQWRFKPGSCQDRPVNVEMLLETSFSRN